MYKKKECIAMLLAGGQGSRLYALTEKTAKPAVPFGAKYRIIDFTLSNCVNSGIDTVGVLTQYQPLVLNEYIGNGQPWDLDRVFGGVMVLPPYQGKKSADWYKGTANAIYQNIDFINRYSPEYVLVLSGDHIYKMDYGLMLEYHKKSGADCTIAVIKVPIEEASRFGVMTADENGRIEEFEEKPAEPKSDLASMGIYIFKRDALLSYLVADNTDPSSQKDFGKNVIPKMLADGKSMFAYRFSGYWKDVGTVDSLWEANMDLLGKSPKFDLYDREWRIFSRTNALPPQYIGRTAHIDNSIVTEGCKIYGRVENSLISEGVTVEEGCCVSDSVIMSGCVLKRGCVIKHSIIDADTLIGEGCFIGETKKQGKNKITVIGSGIKVPAGTVVAAGKTLASSDSVALKEGGEQ